MESFWWIFGISLVALEFVLPGLVSVFVGLGALTVAGMMHFRVVNQLPEQFIVFIASSSLYIFSLRLLVMRWYPSDTERKNIEADDDLIGSLMTVVEEIPAGGVGRVTHADTTWKAMSREGRAVAVGEDVEIVGRENITWIVKPSS